MAFLHKVVFCMALVTAATALPFPKSSPPVYQTEELEDSYKPLPFTEEAFIIPTSLQLPKSEGPQVPFYVPDLSTALRAPQYEENPEPNYYQVPIPSQDLVAPNDQDWNPDNDPVFLYEVPATLTQENTPTGQHPKKFNQELHVKGKPYSSKPKQEIVLRPIGQQEFADKQKTLTKVYDKLAKEENRKELQREGPEFANSFQTETIAGSFPAAFGVSSPLHQSSSNGERHEFHMAGHDGPHSYKWGFDTGKGHNRQFRYEERDKEGIVKGHFGFYDKHGKLQMINYDAHPHDGYHADGNYGKY